MKLKQEYYDLVKNDHDLQRILLTVIPNQDADSLSAMAHIRHDIFVRLEVAVMIANYINATAPDEQVHKVKPIDLIADPNSECDICKEKLAG